MRYLRPHYYDQFECTADKCPATCCAGWQIVIDDDSLKRYEQEDGSFGNRLRNSIDWEEDVFYQYDRRCSFLNERNLCDIYEALGSDALCDTCRLYPRHTEEYENLRELSLSLSCPVAAEMMLSCKEKVTFQESFTEEDEEFEDFDFLMFTQLEDAREVIFGILQNRSLAMEVRMELAEQLSWEFQRCIDEGRSYDIDEMLEEYRTHMTAAGERRISEAVECRKREASGMDKGCGKKGWPDGAGSEAAQAHYGQSLRELQMLEGLERLRPEWTKLLRQTKRILFDGGPERYFEILSEFQEKYVMQEREMWENIAEQLMIFFVYTYFCGSVYDDMVYAKTALALFSTRWIQRLCVARWMEQGQSLGLADIVELSWRFAREIEHSDENLNALEEWLDAQEH
ncbi:MAG: flagellin lysine-N-methylase [Eubacteriales bacterium]|nr:flagellin lysine-N-methylase [Eubacteriales bacterium]